MADKKRHLVGEKNETFTGQCAIAILNSNLDPHDLDGVREQVGAIEKMDDEEALKPEDMN